MFQRDYILRLVEQLAKTLGTVLTFRKAKRFDEAEMTIAEAAKNLVGLDVRTLHALPLEQIVALFSPVIFQNHDPTFFINMPPGSKAYPRINTTTSSDL